MMHYNNNPGFLVCSRCSTKIANGLLACPHCSHLVYGEELKTLADQARIEESSKNTESALSLWRQALEKLPAESRQYEIIAGKIAELGRLIDQDSAESSKVNSTSEKTDHSQKSGWGKQLGIFGLIGMFLWKFKVIFAFLLTKGKLLLLGLTKTSTLFTMLLSFGVYWTAWGWKFALGIVASIYVHEMGHVAALRKYGFQASAPTFIPGLGAIVRMKQYPTNPVENARVGLAGPIWGLAASVIAWIVFIMTNWTMWGAIAKVGAWINLFNLLPVLPLDGGRGFQPLSKTQRFTCAGVIGLMFFLTSEGLLILLFIAAIIMAFAGKSTDKPDNISFVQYILLTIVLSFISKLHVQI